MLVRANQTITKDMLRSFGLLNESCIPKGRIFKPKQQWSDVYILLRKENKGSTFMYPIAWFDVIEA